MYNLIPEVLDVDALHEITERIHRGDPLYRGEGATLARLYLMFGEVELGDPENKYLYIGDTPFWAREVAHHFLQLVYEVYPEMIESIRVQLEPEWRPDMIILPNKQSYRFYSIDNILVGGGANLYGYSFDKIFFDVSPAKQEALESRSADLTNVLQYLFSTGVEIV